MLYPQSIAYRLHAHVKVKGQGHEVNVSYLYTWHLLTVATGQPHEQLQTYQTITISFRNQTVNWQGQEITIDKRNLKIEGKEACCASNRVRYILAFIFHSYYLV